MKKTVCLFVVCAMTAVLAMTAAGCSKQVSEQVSEQDVHQKELESALEEFQAAQETRGASDKVPDPNAEPAEIVMIYTPAEGDVGLERHMDDVPEISDVDLSDKLVEYHVLPDGAELAGFDPYNNIINYTGVDGLTPRQAISIINTFIENFEFEGQWEVQIDGESVMKSGFCGDWKKIDDSFEGGSDDFDSTSSQSGPGVQ